MKDLILAAKSGFNILSFNESSYRYFTTHFSSHPLIFCLLLPIIEFQK
jgi:hypothetical protein